MFRNSEATLPFKADHASSLPQIIANNPEHHEYIDEYIENNNVDVAIAYGISAAYKINKDSFAVKECIGSGSSATVFLGEWNNEHVAIKQIDFKSHNNLNYILENYSQEIKFMARLKGLYHVVQFIGYNIHWPTHSCTIMMEYLSRGSLGSMIKTQREVPLSWDVRYKIMQDISAGLKEIHQHRIIHGDIKSNNIFINEQWESKIGDFGFSIEDEDNTYNRGTPYYVAPEVGYGEGLSTQSDIFSLSITMYEISVWNFMANYFIKLFKLDSYQEEMKAYYRYMLSNERPPIPSNCPPKIAKLVRWGWAADPERRPPTRTLAQELKTDIRTISYGLNAIK